MKNPCSLQGNGNHHVESKNRGEVVDLVSCLQAILGFMTHELLQNAWKLRFRATFSMQGHNRPREPGPTEQGPSNPVP